MSQPPLLMRSPLTGKVYVVTKYTTRPGGLVVADEKTDVTDEFMDLAATCVVEPDNHHNAYACPYCRRDRATEAEVADELAEALRLTVEYVGTGTLPPIEGWSWYDALRKHRPGLLLGFTLPHVYREGERIRNAEGSGYSDVVTDDQIRQHIAEPEESWPGSHAFGHAVLRFRARERAAAEPAQAPLPEGWRCPVHGIPDCSPLLNGCSRVIEHYRGVTESG